jgi:hypothetical protein
VAGVTGLTESAARREGVEADVMYMPGTSHAGYYPGAQEMLLKLVYCPRTGRLLGAQACGADGVDKRIDVLAAAIAGGMTVEDLEQLDLCYAPPFGSAKDVAIVAGRSSWTCARRRSTRRATFPRPSTCRWTSCASASTRSPPTAPWPSIAWEDTEATSPSGS